MIAHLQDAVFHLRMGVKALNAAARKAPTPRYRHALDRLAQRIGRHIADIREAEDIARKDPVA